VYKILAAFMMTALLSTVALAQTAPEGAYMSSKPAACMDTTALFKKFTDDKNEQVIFKYKDPIHNTLGYIFYNPVMKVVHTVELAPAAGGNKACVIVFGKDVKATTWK
tara:strand:+ start:11182 stop:11505 length:324 start_codon:yes stop_codon:yes gene_type:complete